MHSEKEKIYSHDPLRLGMMHTAVLLLARKPFPTRLPCPVFTFNCGGVRASFGLGFDNSIAADRLVDALLRLCQILPISPVGKVLFRATMRHASHTMGEYIYMYLYTHNMYIYMHIHL